MPEVAPLPLCLSLNMGPSALYLQPQYQQHHQQPPAHRPLCTPFLLEDKLVLLPLPVAPTSLSAFQSPPPMQALGPPSPSSSRPPVDALGWASLSPTWDQVICASSRQCTRCVCVQLPPGSWSMDLNNYPSTYTCQSLNYSILWLHRQALALTHTVSCLLPLVILLSISQTSIPIFHSNIDAIDSRACPH